MNLFNFLDDLDGKKKKYLFYGLIPTLIVDGLLIAFVPHRYYDYIAFGVLFLTMVVCLVLMLILKRREESQPYQPTKPSDFDSYEVGENHLNELGVELRKPPMRNRDSDEE